MSLFLQEEAEVAEGGKGIFTKDREGREGDDKNRRKKIADSKNGKATTDGGD